MQVLLVPFFYPPLTRVMENVIIGLACPVFFVVKDFYINVKHSPVVEAILYFVVYPGMHMLVGHWLTCLYFPAV